MERTIPNNLMKLTRELDSLKDIDNQLVSEIVTDSKLEASDFASYLNFEHPSTESYGRNLILDNGKYKILLMSWRPGDFTAIHNHGYTEWGCVVFFGEATHRLYSVDNGELKLQQSDVFGPGQNASVCGDLTHMMGNAGKENFTTLHIYGSNSKTENISADAKVYAPEYRKIFTTMGTAFLNMNQDLILSENPIRKIEEETLLDYFRLVKPFYQRNKVPDVLNRINNFLHLPVLIKN